MQHATLFTFIAIATLALVQPASAQSFDFGVTDVHVSADSVQIPAGITSGLGITITNFDTLSIEPGDTLDVSIEVDGIWYEDQMVLDAALGGLESRYMNFGSGAQHAFGDTLQAVILRGAVSHPMDTNASNDTLAVPYLVNPDVSNDWTAISVEVLSPTNLDSFDIDNGTNVPPAIDQVRVEFMNNGAVTYLQWSVIEYDITLANDTTHVEANLSQGDLPPLGTTVRLLTNASLFPPVPDSAGTYSLCAMIKVLTDSVSENNEACYVFTLVDNFDPSDPANWPFGIDEQATLPFQVVSYTDGIQFLNLERALDIKVFDIQGALINEAHMSSAGRLDMTTAASGIYVLHLTSQDGEVWATKVLKP